MNRWLSMTRRIASSVSLRISAYCALRSSSGTVMVVRAGLAFIEFVSSGSGSRRAAGSTVHPALVLEPLLHRHLAPRPRGSPPHDGARRHVAGDHRARGDQAVLS